MWKIDCDTATVVPATLHARSVDPGSTSLSMLITAPVASRISLILAPAFPMIAPACVLGMASRSDTSGADASGGGWSARAASRSLSQMNEKARKISSAVPVAETTRSSTGDWSEMFTFAWLCCRIHEMVCPPLPMMLPACLPWQIARTVTVSVSTFVWGAAAAATAAPPAAPGAAASAGAGAPAATGTATPTAPPSAAASAAGASTTSFFSGCPLENVASSSSAGRLLALGCSSAMSTP
mmetsp:Transcript_8451/g.21616  ORF Transcript_8451/g.21616 Transcript_8451/m.21616 type:complete len:239 (-) Transcript_8451:60-776(-)